MTHHEFVSRLMTPKVAKHCGAKTNHASNDKAVGKLQLEDRSEDSTTDRSSPLAESA